MYCRPQSAAVDRTNSGMPKLGRMSAMFDAKTGKPRPRSAMARAATKGVKFDSARLGGGLRLAEDQGANPNTLPLKTKTRLGLGLGLGLGSGLPLKT